MRLTERESVGGGRSGVFVKCSSIYSVSLKLILVIHAYAYESLKYTRRNIIRNAKCYHICKL